MPQLFRTLLMILVALLALQSEPVLAGQRTDIHPQANEVQPLLPGMAAPAFTVRNARGEEMAFDPTGLERPLVLSFFRGGWCPYCNLHLAEMRKAESELRQMGFDIWFISIDRPEELYASLEQPEIDYTALSDWPSAYRTNWSRNTSVSESISRALPVKRTMCCRPHRLTS
jgi:peroxiredoxin